MELQTNNYWSLASLSNLCTQITLIGHVEECEFKKGRTLIRVDLKWQPPAEVARYKNGRLNVATANVLAEVDERPRDTESPIHSSPISRNWGLRAVSIGPHVPYCRP